MNVKVNVVPPRVIKIRAIQGGKERVVVTGKREVHIITASKQGPPGKDAADISSIPVIAGETLSGHRVVSVFNNVALYADKDTRYEGQLGLTKSASNSGDPVEAFTMGVIVEPSWSLMSGPVFLGNNGLLTQIKPSSGAVIIVGMATSPTSISIQFQKLYKVN